MNIFVTESTSSTWRAAICRPLGAKCSDIAGALAPPNVKERFDEVISHASRAAGLEPTAQHSYDQKGLILHSVYFIHQDSAV